ncbi:hypothetical protein SAMN05421770_101268 [Granulicella rosea]|uniref:Uncharacterized protein n=2 Tax=Granulicella rosea TaxID=474952 RepID=A0A239D5J9_9BACT|nr:hypothetical protein SAMN05421770_101268 [Granulicella rosea]
MLASTPEMYFYTNPAKQLFWVGEPVVIGLELYSRFEQPVLVAPLQNNEFVQFKLVGPDGNEVPWQGKAPDHARAYSPSDFKVLEQYNAVKAERTISLKDGTGFACNRPGQYTLTAVFSMGSPEHFTLFADQAKPIVGSVRSSKLAFCIDACILKQVPVSNDAPPSALQAVGLFYTDVIKYHSSGIPVGHIKEILGPLMSKKLAQEIDSLSACDKDYFRRYGEILRVHTLKAAIPWGEAGLFTGPNDASTPSAFRILGSRAIGENRVDVLIAFKEDWGESQGDVTVVLENNRWVIDDYVAMYENDKLERLSAGYSVCKDGRWVGEPAY